MTTGHMASMDTFPKLLLRNYERLGDRKVAYRKKELGIWQFHTWKDVYDTVKYFSLGLINLGLKRGERVVIIGDNRPQWILAQWAIHSAGGISVGAYQDSGPAEVKHVVELTGAKFIIAEDQEQADKILQIASDLPGVSRVIYWDTKGMAFYDDPILMRWEEIIERGKALEDSRPGVFEQNVFEGKGNDVASIAMTSGTTKLPKGVVLTHGGMVEGTRVFGLLEPLCEDDELFSAAPLAWMGEQVLSILRAMVAGASVSFPEEPETAQADMREIGISMGLMSPRVLEGQHSQVQVKMSDARFLKKLVYTLAIPVGYKVGDLRAEGKKVSLFWRLLYQWNYYAALRPVRDQLGYLKTKALYTGGASIASEITRFYHAIGVNLKTLYAITEGGSIPVAQPDGEVKFGSAGKVVEKNHIRITDEGQVLLRTPGLSLGYFKDTEATNGAFKNGWLLSGDQGLIEDDGHLIFIDRMSEVMMLSTGSKFAPQWIADKLRTSPHIQDAIILGHDRPAVAALLAIDFANVGRWAEEHRISYTTFVDLSQKPQVYELMRKEVERVNRFLPGAAKIKRFSLLHKALDPDEAELTRTRKVRRSYFEERHKTMIQALYGNEEEVEIEAEVSYRDGRKGTMKTLIRIISLGEE